MTFMDNSLLRLVRHQVVLSDSYVYIHYLILSSKLLQALLTKLFAMHPSEPVLEPGGSSDSEEETGTFTSGREADFQ